MPKGDNWEQFYSEISSCNVYNNEETITKLLTDMNTMPIKNVHIMDGGTQVISILTSYFYSSLLGEAGFYFPK